jgi:Ni/Co efflux regulator RcnB
MMRLAINEAHQGVMIDRQHSLKRGDRLSKKERQTTASDWKKATNCDLC